MALGILRKKLPYYWQALYRVALHIHNPWALVFLALGKTVTLNFKIGMRFTISQPIDVLIIYETIILDVCHIRKLKAPRRIIDVGAAFGNAVVYAAHTHPSAHVIAFEPNPESFRLLKKNVDANALTNVSIEKKAISTSKSITLAVQGRNVEGSALHKKNKQAALHRVPASSLDPLLTAPVDLVIIDCEGSEMDILASISPRGFSQITRFVLEYHNHLIPSQDLLITRLLREKGYHCRKAEDPYNRDIGYIYATRKI